MCMRLGTHYMSLKLRCISTMNPTSRSCVFELPLHLINKLVPNMRLYCPVESKSFKIHTGLTVLYIPIHIFLFYGAKRHARRLQQVGRPRAQR